MNMNFIAFSSRVKLLDRPHLDAAAAGHRHLRGHLDGLLQIPGLDQQQTFLDAGVRLLLGHRVHVVLDNIYQADGLQDPPAAGEWLRTSACRSEGAEIDSRDGYARKSARRARSSAAMRRSGSEPSSAVRAA